jgi:hypothetical protein
MFPEAQNKVDYILNYPASSPETEVEFQLFVGNEVYP